MRLLAPWVVVILVLPARPAVAQSDTEPRRLFLSADVATFQHPAAGESYTLTKVLYDEPAVGTATYAASARTSMAMPTASVALGHRLLLGARVMLPQYHPRADLSLQLPHPFVANRPLTATLVTDPLQRKDVIVDLMVSYLVNRGQWAVQVSGGPTYFTTSQEMVRGMNYRESLIRNSLTITDIVRETVTGSTWGANGGVDVSYYISRHIGVGGGARANVGSVRIAEEPLSGEPATLSVGLTTVNGGLRFRF